MLTNAEPLDLNDPANDVEWHAWWLKDPLFARRRPRTILSPARNEENRGELQNIHTFFRRAFHVSSGEIRQARLFITADDCYKLYLNGHFIGTGPAPSYPFDYPYNGWDVTALLNGDADNCIGVHVYYQGLHNLAWVSADNLQGMLLQLEIAFSDNSTETLISDGEWRCHRTDAYMADQLYGYQTAFSEHIDMRRLPVGWHKPGFNDQGWDRPAIGPQQIPSVYSLTPQTTPPVAYYRKEPARIESKGDGNYFVDFGCEVVGETVFIVSGSPGQQVEIRHGEELAEPDTVRYKMRCNCEYQEFVTLSGRGNEQVEFFDYKGFRYVEVLNWPEPLTTANVYVLQRHYPFPEDACSFDSASDLLNEIWQLCSDGVRVGTLDTYMDCPTREKGGFLGDGFITGISHLILSGDARILRKFLKDVANSGRICPGLLGVAPTNVTGENAQYSMLWPPLLAYYYQWTADADFVEEMQSTLDGLLTYYGGYENKDGLLEDVLGPYDGGYAVLVDWPKNFRDNYEDPLLWGQNQTGVVNTMLNGFYYNMLQAAAELKEIAGEDDNAKALRTKTGELREAMLTHLRDENTGLFVDCNGSTHSALHANAVPLLAGMVPSEEQTPILNLLKEKRMSCGVYFSCFLLNALYHCGENNFAYELITSDDRHSWHSMLEAGATTCMEAWAPDLKFNTSWCHPWSSAPIQVITHHMMGLRPGKPGWSSFIFAPQPPYTLPWADLRITTPVGPAEVEFKREGDKIRYTVSIPEDRTVSCYFRTQNAGVVVDDEELECRSDVDAYGVVWQTLPRRLNGGTHVIRVEA